MAKRLVLRDYQQKHFNELFKCGKDRVLIQSPTGTGKSVEMAAIIEHLLSSGIKRICVITPNRELVRNLKNYLGTKATMAFSRLVPNMYCSVLITTYQSGKKYIKNFDPQYIISDEAHSAKAETWEKLIPDGIPHLGYTATPSRLDGKPLKDLFDYLITSPSIKWFVDKGYLAPYQIIPKDIPEWILQKNDDLGSQESIFGSVPEIKKTVKLWLEECQDRKTLIFCTTIQHGIMLEKEFMKHSVDARFLSSKSPIDERDIYYDQFKSGSLKVLINVNLFKVGIDIPDCDTVFACRFFGSQVDAFQSFGRGTRPHPGKLYKYYDLSGTSYYHGDFGLKDDWSLESKPYKETSNYHSVYHRCFKCDTELFHKSKIEELTMINCHKCGFLNVMIPRVRLGEEGKAIVEQSFEKFKFKPEYGALIAHMVSIERSTKFSKWEKIEKLLTLQIPNDVKLEKFKFDIFTRLGIPIASTKSFMNL